MSDKLKAVGVIGDWPIDPDEREAAIAEQERVVSIIAEIEEIISIYELDG